MTGKVVPFPVGMPRAVAERRIRELAQDSASWNVPLEFGRQMQKSGITMRQVIEAIRFGSVSDDPTRNENGDWVCTLRRRCAGRVIHVVVALSKDKRLTVVATN